MTTADDLESLARAYLASIERGDFEQTQQYFDRDVLQQEFPNRLTPEGKSRDLKALREAAAKGSHVVRGQRYEIKSLMVSGSTVAIEAQWSATLAVPLGLIPEGGEMRAHLAMFIEYREGRIVRQRNYDCFEPF